MMWMIRAHFIIFDIALDCFDFLRGNLSRQLPFFFVFFSILQFDITERL